MARTLVTFHAHPDDEALLTAGTMAKAAATGDRVVLVVATRGEVGDAAAAYRAGGLGDQRVAETEASVAALGVHRLVFLGYGDSGLDGDGSGLTGAATEPFARAGVDEAAERLAEVLREEHADVVTTYDPNGGYGHPDHLQVHRVGRRAAELAGTPVVLEATINRDLMQAGIGLAASLGLDVPPEFSPETFESWFLPEAELTHAVDVTAQLEQKRASMRAHASQATSDVTDTRSLSLFLSLPDDYFALAFGTEWYVDRSRPPGIAAHDVFDGLTNGAHGDCPNEALPGDREGDSGHDPPGTCGPAES
jgi:LmbE family N-acetylglucosaminyl deacetylase